MGLYEAWREPKACLLLRHHEDLGTAVVGWGNDMWLLGGETQHWKEVSGGEGHQQRGHAAHRLLVEVRRCSQLNKRGLCSSMESYDHQKPLFLRFSVRWWVCSSGNVVCLGEQSPKWEVK